MVFLHNLASGDNETISYGLLMGQHPSKNTLAAEGKISSMYMKYFEFFIRKLQYKCELLFYYRYYLSFNQYNLTHYTSFKPIKPFF